ncbi:MAG TPA: hypothetical protein VJ866_17460 [Pyrinomonadaceae bacterium]|nr:hypothetical protein [Pyrinomonadaceae bacterium]
MTENGKLGRIITFYSYKGGTGRSMALANVAWILASNGKRVLAIDWDLEAPGLHRYFSPFLADKELAASEGLINFVDDYRVKAMTPPADGRAAEDWYLPYADISDYAVAVKWDFRDGGRIDLVPAGRQDDSYSQLFNLFNWQDFYTPLGGGKFLEVAKRVMRRKYDYILIDSRTGVSDTSGICTIMMPDTLVVLFTMNNQGIDGAARVAHSVAKQREQGPPIKIFPVPTRIDNGELQKLGLRTQHAKKKFASFPRDKDLPRDMTWEKYWEQVPVLYVTYYAYEEVLSAFGDTTGSITSMLASAERLTSFLTDGEVSRLVPPPEARRKEILRLYEGGEVEADPTVKLAEDAERELTRMSAEQRTQAERLLLRLVSVTPMTEAGGGEVHPTKVVLDRLPEQEQAVVQRLAGTGLLVLERKADSAADTSGYTTVGLSSDELLQKWERLSALVEANREFLLWRQAFTASFNGWLFAHDDPSELLGGRKLDEASRYLRERPDDLTRLERGYIEKSIEAAERRRRRRRYRRTAIAAAGLVVAIFFGYVGWQAIKARQARFDTASRLAADASKLDPQSDPRLKVLLAVEALKLDASQASARGILNEALPQLPVRVDSLQHVGRVTQIAFSPDGTLLSSLSENPAPTPDYKGGASGQSTQTQSLLFDVSLNWWDVGHKTELRARLFSAESNRYRYVLKGQYAAYVTQSDAPARADLHVVEVGQGEILSCSLKGIVTQLAFSDDGDFFGVARDNDILLWKLKVTQSSSPRVLGNVTSIGSFNARDGSFSFSPDGKYVVTIGKDRKYHVWDTATGTEVGKAMGHSDFKVAFSNPNAAAPFGRTKNLLLTSNAGNKSIELWDWESDRLRTTLIYDEGAIDFALSPDNAFLAASVFEHGLVLVRTSGGPDFQPATLDKDTLTPVFNADGRYLAGLGAKDGLPVWEFGGGGLSRKIRVLSDRNIMAAAFGPADDSGQLLATAEGDGTMRVWRLTPTLSNDLSKDACSRLTRNMTKEEWQRYMSGEYRRTCEELP